MSVFPQISLFHTVQDRRQAKGCSIIQAVDAFDSKRSETFSDMCLSSLLKECNASQVVQVTILAGSHTIALNNLRIFEHGRR